MDLWEVAPAIDYLTNNLKAFAVDGRSRLPDQAPCGISASLMSSSQSLTSFVFSKLLALLVIMGKVVKLLCTFSLAPESWHGFELRGLCGLISGRLYFWVKRHLKGLSVREGQTDFWLSLAKKCMNSIVCTHLYTWDMPNMIRGDTGEVIFGKDYYQMLMLWSLPAVVKGQDMGGPTKEGGLVARMIAAAN